MKTLTVAIFVFALLVGCVVPPQNSSWQQQPQQQRSFLNDPLFWQGWQLMNQQPRSVTCFTTGNIVTCQ